MQSGSTGLHNRQNLIDNWLFYQAIAGFDNENKNMYYVARNRGGSYYGYFIPWDMNLSFGAVIFLFIKPFHYGFSTGQLIRNRVHPQLFRGNTSLSYEKKSLRLYLKELKKDGTFEKSNENLFPTFPGLLFLLILFKKAAGKFPRFPPGIRHIHRQIKSMLCFVIGQSLSFKKKHKLLLQRLCFGFYAFNFYSKQTAVASGKQFSFLALTKAGYGEYKLVFTSFFNSFKYSLKLFFS